MAGWARALPVVTPLESVEPKAVTLVLPYYECPEFFAVQCEHLRRLPEDIAPYLKVIVVDDGSPTKPLVLPADLPCAIRGFRIERDVPWNWLAARNIGAHHAGGWLLLTDMDHEVPMATLRAAIWSQHDESVIYAFSRREYTGESLAPHSASFLMHRDLFWRIGGYDERLSGHYGTDGDWRRRCAAFAEFRVLSDVLIRHEYVKDSSTTTYVRKSPEDAVAVKQLVAARGRDWRPTALTFPYHEVTT
jgi:hypothetical protein